MIRTDLIFSESYESTILLLYRYVSLFIANKIELNKKSQIFFIYNFKNPISIFFIQIAYEKLI